MKAWVASHPEIEGFLTGETRVFPQEILDSREHQTFLIGKDNVVIWHSTITFPSANNQIEAPDVEAAWRSGFGFYATDTIWASIRVGKVPNEGVVRWGFPNLPWDEFQRNSWLRILPGLFVLLALEILFTLWISGPFCYGIETLVSATRGYINGNPIERLRLPQNPVIQRLSWNIHFLIKQGELKNEALQRQNQELESLLAGMSEGVIVVDENLVVRRINPAARTLFAILPKFTEGKSILETTHSTALLQMVETILKKGKLIETEIILGEAQHLQVKGSYVAGEERSRLVILVLNNITHLRRLEDVRKDFVANVSHELKTPITNIKGYIETLLEGDVDAQKTTQFHEVILSHADRMTDIIDDLLTLSRLEGSGVDESNFGTLNLETALKEALEICKPKAEKKNITWSLGLKAGNALVKGHTRLAVQAMVNLVDNAIKYSSEKSEVQVGIMEGLNFWSVIVKDHGIGIPQKDIDRVFERFYRVDKGRSRELGGTGLGLSIVKHIMILHNGRIEVESERGHGSSFILHFPKQT